MQNITVGIVDDDAQTRRDIKDKLALSEEVEVLFEADNGEGLLKNLNRGQLPKVLLMDVQMPTMDGITATRQARKLYPHIKVIMLTIMDDDKKPKLYKPVPPAICLKAPGPSSCSIPFGRSWKAACRCPPVSPPRS